jgi:hypothetical protein
MIVRLAVYSTHRGRRLLASRIVTAAAIAGKTALSMNAVKILAAMV